VGTDSRETKPGGLFVCIRGERADGHDFAHNAEEAGAAAILASHAPPGINTPLLLVPDTVRALGQLASYWRKTTRAKVIGVTGTAGKTTLKELLAQILATRGKTARNALNYNNQVGLPRAMLTADGDEHFWVMEAGISREGDMEYLAEILRPDLGLILNAGAGHTENLGRRGVAVHKATLLRYLAPGGSGLISADYPDLTREAVATGAKLHFFSAGNAAVNYQAVYEGPASGCGIAGAAYGHYRLCLDGEWISVTAPFRGQYGAENCIAAAAAAHRMGLAGDEIAAGFARVAMPAQRFSLTRINGWDVIDDTYNANPLSMRRMLDAAVELAEGRAVVAVLGEMLELGHTAAGEHEDLGRYLAALAPAGVLWKGGHARNIHAGLKKYGYDGTFFPLQKRGDFFTVVNDLVHGKNLKMKGGVFLFKGSRANRLEEELADFRAHFCGGPDITAPPPGENKNVL
jgi:UDP-N-acetylmuramoyl-tripeptide--D-alanyl-D-alanine ligase